MLKQETQRLRVLSGARLEVFVSENGVGQMLEACVGQVVVLDTQGPLIYIGTLERVGEGFFVLREADVHDTNDSRASKELYLLETKELGVRANRARVHVAGSVVASVSLLADVVG